MTLSKHTILGVSITTSSKQTILSYCTRHLSSVIRHQSSIITIVTPNPEQVMLAQDNEQFRNILNRATIALPDGAGIVWAIKKNSKFRIQNSKLVRISGRAFMMDLCTVAAQNDARVFLVGGRPGAATQTLKKLQIIAPGLQGFVKEDIDLSDSPSIPEAIVTGLVQTIRSRNIRLVFLAFGAPKQEYLLDALTTQLSLSSSVLSHPVIIMVVGGAFDTISGNIPEAPPWMQDHGLEWLWRLIHEPWRFKRQTMLIRYFWRVIGEKYPH